jgi:hypothetical protein
MAMFLNRVDIIGLLTAFGPVIMYLRAGQETLLLLSVVNMMNRIWPNYFAADVRTTK